MALALMSSLPGYQAILIASYSLVYRLADLRAARGDDPGAARARSIARVIERASGLGLWGVVTNPVALVEALWAIKNEVVAGGGFLKDVLRLGGNGFIGLIQKLKGFACQ